ncbi:SP-RING-type domain-containing protein [Psidium guajava]|nr:SP-RING-type domain-containing protein [Psidium guajava]
MGSTSFSRASEHPFQQHIIATQESEIEGTGKECKGWEEEIYLTHFHSIHFCQFLHGDFHQKLVSPPFTRTLML